MVNTNNVNEREMGWVDKILARNRVTSFQNSLLLTTLVRLFFKIN